MCRGVDGVERGGGDRGAVGAWGGGVEGWRLVLGLLVLLFYFGAEVEGEEGWELMEFSVLMDWMMDGF